MTKANGYILKLNRKRWKEFEDSISYSGFFADPVESFNHPRNNALICFICDPSGKITHIASGKKGKSAGYKRTRLNFNDVVELETPVRSAPIINMAEPSLQRWIESTFDNGGLFPPKTFENFIDIFIEISPESAPLLAKYGEVQRNRVKRLTSREKTNLASQKESIATALAISNIERSDLKDWTISSDETPTSFLEGLDVVRLREDPMVMNDMMILPGHEFIRRLPYGAAVFKGPTSHLTVLLTNRQSLETQTGTDLIYYNATFKAFVMVQYKAMEKEGNKAVFRFPNDTQLTEEIRRMDSVMNELRKIPPKGGRDEFRLNQNPFFLKFCPRLLFNPDDTGLIPGMYLPLEYWKLCMSDPTMVGPRKGKKLTYDNVRRYMGNSEFVHVVSKAWVGTSITQSAVLEKIIKDSLESGKAVTIAIKRSDGDPPDGENQRVTNPNKDGVALEVPVEAEPLTVKLGR